MIRRHASELFSRRLVKDLLEQFSKRAPGVVEDIVPTIVPISTLHRTLRALLAERVSIRDLGTILETLAEFAPKLQDPDLLTDLVRERLARSIVRPYVEDDGSLRVITLAPDVEETLKSGVTRTDSGAFLSVDPTILDGLLQGIESAVSESPSIREGKGPVLLISQSIRSALRQVLARITPRLAVLSHNELPAEVRIVAQNVVRPANAH